MPKPATPERPLKNEGREKVVFERLTENLPGKPGFRQFRFRDHNPLSGTTKWRTLYDPNPAMRIVHRRLIRYLRTLRVNLGFATGARPKFSAQWNAKIHQRGRFFYLLDIYHAYEFVDGRRLAKILCSLDENLEDKEDEVLGFLKTYCMGGGTSGLSMGFPASPDLFNIYAAILVDYQIAALAKQYGLTYTRYLDDIALSSTYAKIGQRKRRKIRDAIEGAGFLLNDGKAQVVDLKKRTIVITGVGLRYGGETFVPRRYHRRMVGITHMALMHGGPLVNRAHGMMGVHKTATKNRSKNRTEQRLQTRYSQLRFVRS